MARGWSAGCLLAGLLLGGGSHMAAAGAADPLALTFKGTVEPRERVEIANRINGVISKVLIVAGQHVDEGDPLFEIDPGPFKLDVLAAQAELDEVRARLRLAEDVSGRQSQLAARGSGAEARATQATIEVDVARAAVARQESALARAELAFKRTRIVAPIAGIVGRPHVSPGAFVEAEAGTVLGEIVQIDPVLVAYQVPYGDRQRALEKTGTKTPRQMFGHIVLTIVLPSGESYPHRGTPQFESANVDRQTGMLTTWGEFPNPDGILVPGLKVEVLSEIHADPLPRGVRR